MHEIDLFPPLIRYLEARGGKVYAEPAIALNGNPAPPDLVYVADDGVFVYEGKTRLNGTLFNQCERWLDYADFTYAIVPQPKRRSLTHGGLRSNLDNYGIGLIYVIGDSIDIQIHAGEKRRANTGVIKCQLDDIRPGGVPGMAGGKRVARDKWSKLRAYLKKNPYSTMLDIKIELDCYDRADRREIIKLTNREEISGVRKTHDGQYFLETM